LSALKINRDVVIVLAVFTLFVSSTTAWYFNPIVEEKTMEIVSIIETPFVVLQSDYVYLGSNKIVLTLELENSAISTQSTNIEIQALDSSGEIILDGEVEMIQNSTALNIPPGGTYMESFTFEKTGLRTELNVFMIILWWDTTQGVFTSGGGTSITPKAFIAYRSSDISGPKFPKYRLYDLDWSMTLQLNEPADQEVLMVRSAWNPASSMTDNALIILLTDQGYVDAYKYDSFSWNYARLGRVWKVAPIDMIRPFDCAYESLSGDAVLVYKDNSTDPSRDLVYQIWDGSGWTDPAYIDDPMGRKEYYWVTLESDPLTDEIAMIGVTSDGDVNCWVWDGSSWGSHYLLSTSVTDVGYEVASIAWEFNSGEAIAAVADGQYVKVARYAGSWSGMGSFSLVLNPNSMTPDINWVMLKPHRVSGSDRVMLMALDAGEKLYTRQWSGSSWLSLPELMDDKLQSGQSRCFDGDWMPTGTSFILFAGQFNTQLLSYKVWSPSGWNPSGAGSWSYYSGATDRQEWIQVRSNPKAEYPEVIVATVDASSNLVVTAWDGATLQDQTVITTESTLRYEAYELAFTYNP
jgi:hypothetical protein